MNRRRELSIVFLLSTSFAWATISACVGDAPGVSSSDGGGGDSGSASDGTVPVADGNTPGADGSTGTDANPIGDAGGDVSCTAPLQACDGGCVDTTMSDDNCGACGHTCGGGKCATSACGPATLYPNIGSPNNFAIDAVSVYATFEDKVASCPLAGCAGKQPTQLAALASGYPTGWIGSSNGRIYFVASPANNTERYGIYTCPLAGCPVTIPFLTAGNMSSFSSVILHGDTVFYLNPQSGVFQGACPNGACSTPIEITNKPLAGLAIDDVPPDAGVASIYTTDTSTTDPTALELVKCPAGAASCVRTVVIGDGRYSSDSYVNYQLAVHAGIIYMNCAGRLSGGNGIFECPVGGCPNATEFQSSFNEIPDMQVDDSGIYWIDASNPPEIHTCPLAGCTGGVKKVYGSAAGATIVQLALDPTYVYWLETAPGDAGVAGTVYRIAK